MLFLLLLIWKDLDKQELFQEQKTSGLETRSWIVGKQMKEIGNVNFDKRKPKVNMTALQIPERMSHRSRAKPFFPCHSKIWNNGFKLQKGNLFECYKTAFYHWSVWRWNKWWKNVMKVNEVSFIPDMQAKPKQT